MYLSGEFSSRSGNITDQNIGKSKNFSFVPRVCQIEMFKVRYSKTVRGCTTYSKRKKCFVVQTVSGTVSLNSFTTVDFLCLVTTTQRHKFVFRIVQSK